MFNLKSNVVKFPTYKKINLKNGRLPANLAQVVTCNKLCVYLIGTGKIHMKGKPHLIPKYIMMINPVVGWF